MSSAVISTSAALGRPFVFDDEAVPDVRSLPGAAKKPAGSEDSPQESLLARVFQSTIHKKSIMPLVTPASRLDIRPAPEMVSSGVSAIDALTGGFPRGCLTEICGPASSGRTTLLLAALAAATRRGEFCVVVDASDTLDAQSASAAGVELERLLWVRCGEDAPRKQQGTEKQNNPRDRNGARNINQPEHRLEQALRATDLLLESGGFGLIILDLGDLPPQSARRIPLTTWFRFRRAVEHKPTVLLAIEQQPIVGSCSSLLLQLGSPADESAAKRRKSADHGASRWLFVENEVALEGRKKNCKPGDAPTEIHFPHHAQLLTGLHINAELICSRLQRKPAQSITFATKTAWAG
jgi:hypothetical protein